MDDERTLADVAEDLAETLEALRGELREPPRGPVGAPRAPTPRELLRFAEGYAIPTLIAILEANVRLLESLAAAIRLADGRPIDAERRDRLARASRSTLRRLDGALDSLATAAEGGEPSNPEVRQLLEEARSLRGEIDDRLAAATERAPDGNPEEPTHEKSAQGGADEIGIDVDEELASIRRELDGDDAGDRDDGAEGSGDEP